MIKIEYLDIYDENGNHIGKEDRNIVHRDALWHKTVHAWLYDKNGNVYFQIRTEEGTLYTTASGHLQAGDTVEQAFAREIKEEIGLDIDSSDAIKVDVIKFILDRKNKDGTMFRDRAFANVYIDDFEGTIDEFNFDPNEVKGLVKVNAKKALNLFETEEGTIKGIEITFNGKENVEIEKDYTLKDFLVNKGETAITKYGNIMKKIIEVTNK